MNVENCSLHQCNIEMKISPVLYKTLAFTSLILYGIRK